MRHTQGNMIVAACAFIAGVLMLQQLAVLPGPQWLYTALPVVLLLYKLRYWPALFAVMGFVWAACTAIERMDDRLLAQIEGVEVWVSGEITGLPQIDERRVRFNFIPFSSAVPLPHQLRLSWYYPKIKVRAGQQWRFKVKLKRPHSLLNPGGFDYQRWLLMQDIGATGYVRNPETAILLAQQSAWQSISVWRQQLAEHLTELMQDRESLALVKALTLGDRQAVSQQQWDLFRRTGTVHLMAISGLHIGLVASLIYFLVLRGWAYSGILKWPPPRVAAVAALLAAGFYAALAGFSIPTQRALLMLAVVMLAVVLQRQVKIYNTLAIAAFVVVMLDPMAVLSAGFWLSFVAVGIIVLAVSGRLRKPGHYLAIIKVHWVAAIGLLPLLLFYFQQFALFSPVANFIAVPIVSLVVVPLSLLSVLLLYGLPEVSGWLLQSVGMVLHLLQQILAYLAAQPFAVLTKPLASTGSLMLAGIAILLLLLPRGVPGRWLAGVLLLPVLIAKQQQLPEGHVRLTLLDVGQGLSAVVQTQNHLLVFDAGAKYSSQFDRGRDVVLPFLHNQGAERLDILLISHADNDHIGGAKAILEALPVRRLLTSVPEKLPGFGPRYCKAGQHWVWDGVSFNMLSPEPGVFQGENNNSCVLKIDSIPGAILLTGDIEAEAEQWLAKVYSKRLKADVLVAPHHGSKTSSSAVFLDNVRPGNILIPAGYRNRFGFPHQEVLQRYHRIGAKIFNVASLGALSVELPAKTLKVKSQLLARGKYWNFLP